MGQTRTDRRSACRAPWGAGLVFFQMIMRRACLSDGPRPGPSGGEWHLVHAEKPAIRWPDELSRASCPVPGGHRRKVGTGARRGRSSPAPCQHLGAAGGRPQAPGGVWNPACGQTRSRRDVSNRNVFFNKLPHSVAPCLFPTTDPARGAAGRRAGLPQGLRRRVAEGGRAPGPRPEPAQCRIPRRAPQIPVTLPQYVGPVPAAGKSGGPQGVTFLPRAYSWALSWGCFSKWGAVNQLSRG